MDEGKIRDERGKLVGKIRSFIAEAVFDFEKETGVCVKSVGVDMKDAEEADNPKRKYVNAVTIEHSVRITVTPP